jgi:HEAT repeat protein
MRFLFPLLLLSVLSTGCSKELEATLSGGHPVSYWVQQLQSKDLKERKQAAFKLGNVGPSDPSVVPALLTALKDGKPEVRCEAILALVKCGAEAKAALPMLAELKQRDRDAKVREYAGKAVEKLGEG